MLPVVYEEIRRLAVQLAREKPWYTLSGEWCPAGRRGKSMSSAAGLGVRRGAAGRTRGALGTCGPIVPRSPGSVFAPPEAAHAR
jgi:hypothetical protein